MEIKGVCYHEASHLVFAIIFNKLDANFALPSYVIIEENGNGKIDGGILQAIYTGKWRQQLDLLTTKQLKIAQIMYSLAGYSSSIVFINLGIKLFELDEFDHPIPTDISKCDVIASTITKNDMVVNGGLNQDNINLLSPIYDETIKIINDNPTIKKAIQFAAMEICESNGINGDQMVKLIKSLQIHLNEINGEELIAKFI